MNPKRKKTSPPLKSPMKTQELITYTMAKTNKGMTVTTSSTVNQLLCERTVQEQINLSWPDVLGLYFY